MGTEANCHIHMVLDGVDWKQAIARHREQPDCKVIRQALGAYQALGCRYLRDGGDRWGVGAMARGLAPEYGITYRTPLAPLCRKGCYGGFLGRTYEDLGEYRALVRQTKDSGGDFIKIMISGIMDFDRFGVLMRQAPPVETVAELVEIAHQEGMAVMAHGNGADCVRQAALAGVESIEHGAYLDQEALQAMADHRVVWVPTLSTIGNLRGTGRFREEAVAKILRSAMENVRRYHAMGGLIASGDDAGAWAVPHGCDTEDALLLQAGLTESDIRTGNQEIISRF